MRLLTALLFIMYCLLSLAAISCFNSQPPQLAVNVAQTIYQCLPCGSFCDKETYKSPGDCSHCHMPLVPKSSITFASVQPAAICDFIQKHPGAVLLDVRTREEFEGKVSPNFGTLKGAINIPVQELESKLASISHLKKKEVLVFCSHSHRSPRASYLLTQNGFTNVTNMDGGMSQVTDSTCKK